jgi:hypothetical protein
MGGAMRIEEALATRLRNDGAVAGLVMDRIFPQVAPQGTSSVGTADAYVTYELLIEKGVYAHDTSDATGLKEARLSFGCYAGRYATVKSLAAAVTACLNGFRGTLSGLEVGKVLVDECNDLFDETLRLRGVAVDVDVMYTA